MDGERITRRVSKGLRLAGLLTAAGFVLYKGQVYSGTGDHGLLPLLMCFFLSLCLLLTAIAMSIGEEEHGG